MEEKSDEDMAKSVQHEDNPVRNDGGPTTRTDGTLTPDESISRQSLRTLTPEDSKLTADNLSDSRFPMRQAWRVQSSMPGLGKSSDSPGLTKPRSQSLIMDPNGDTSIRRHDFGSVGNHEGKAQVGLQQEKLPLSALADESVKDHKDAEDKQRFNSFSSNTRASGTSGAASPVSRQESSADLTSANVRVVIRVRPLFSTEKQRGDKIAVEYLENGGILVESGPSQTKPFTFNAVFNDQTTQEQIFEECGISELINKALDGFSTTVFAFGQTGSGKTHTITGPVNQVSGDILLKEEQFGLVPRSFDYLFHEIEKRSEVTYVVKASFLEVYNEKVRDLLNPSNAYESLTLRWSRNAGFYVENLFAKECESFDDLMGVLVKGLDHRHIGEHALNDHSSRSHSLLTLYLRSEEVDPDDETGYPVVKHGKICFVDLAGSERVKETKTSGEALNESNKINKSLLTLGKCISALSDARKRMGHIPYRDSKLTKLLAESLGGEGYTLMIACISPSSYVIQDTMNTLRYASRAKCIKNKPLIKMDPREQLISRLKHEMKFLKAENAYFREQLGVPCSEAQVILTPSQIKGELTPGEAGMLSPAIGGESLSSFRSSRSNSSKDVALKDQIPRAATALFALGAKNGLYDLLQEYMIENENLRTENRELHKVHSQAQREQERLFRENERLSQKIDDLGRVMLSTPMSREHVRSWMLSETPLAFSKQPTEETFPGRGSKLASGGVKFPPVKTGTYPNYISNVDLSMEMEMEKQKLREERERTKLERASVAESSEAGRRPSAVSDDLRTDEEGASQKARRVSKVNPRAGIEDVDLHDKASKAAGDSRNNRVGDLTPGERLPNGKSERSRSRKFQKPRRKKKTAAIVDKPAGYAAKFAVRKGLLLKLPSTDNIVTPLFNPTDASHSSVIAHATVSQDDHPDVTGALFDYNLNSPFWAPSQIRHAAEQLPHSSMLQMPYPSPPVPSQYPTGQPASSHFQPMSFMPSPNGPSQRGAWLNYANRFGSVYADGFPTMQPRLHPGRPHHHP